jgi:hypothetical protein
MTITPRSFGAAWSFRWPRFSSSAVARRGKIDLRADRHAARPAFLDTRE